MRYPRLPLSALSPWTKLHDVMLYDVDVQDVGANKGYGFVATRQLSSQDTFDMPTLINIPGDLILCANFIEEHAKVDQLFRELLAVAGNKSLRRDVMLFLLTQLTIVSPDCPNGIGVSNSWTEYVRMLPPDVPVPTTWTEEQLMILIGTSLETEIYENLFSQVSLPHIALMLSPLFGGHDHGGPKLFGLIAYWRILTFDQAALSAKSVALEREFEELRDSTSKISWCQKSWWEPEALTLTDWLRLDAWYRSRCLELPRAGESMVPCLDMANHAAEANSYYEESKNGDVLLLLRPNTNLLTGDEVSISYGCGKSPAEMLFSYGFVDNVSTSRSLVLDLSPFPDDPLGKAKLAAFSGRPVVQISKTSESMEWKSEFAFFMCLNEEDGLDLRMLQENDGTRGELKVFWQDKDVTQTTNNFEEHIEGHSLKDVFKLRVVSLLQDRLQRQIERLYESEDMAAVLASTAPQNANESIYTSALQLRSCETQLMEQAYQALENQKAGLIESPAVLEYLESMRGPSEEFASGAGEHEDEDFS